MPYALITGGSKGIGKAIAIELARRKYDLLLVSRSGTLLQETAMEISKDYSVTVNFFIADLSLRDAAHNVHQWCIQNTFNVSVLVNNAGYGLCGLFEEFTLEEQTNMMQLNMTTVVQFCHLFLPMLKQQSRSYILNVSSTTAYQSLPLMSVYAASKVFVLNFSRALNYELRLSGVSVTCLCPGSTNTDFVIRAGIGSKALETAKKVHMSPGEVAKIGVNAMFAGKAEVITGAINKIGVFLVWLLPKSLVEKTAARIYSAR